MRRPRYHSVTEDSAIHKIWRAHDREFLLASEEDKRSYLDALLEDYQREELRDYFLILAYVVMENHVHELVYIKEEPRRFSDHMRRAHGRFGLRYNRAHARLGKVAHDRPKTLRIQDARVEQKVLFYIFANVVKSGKSKDAGHIRFRNSSAFRFYAYGEKNDYSEMLSYPDWYMALGKTPKLRQRKFRSLFNRYLFNQGLIEHPEFETGFLIGDAAWIERERTRFSYWGMYASLDCGNTGPPG